MAQASKLFDKKNGTTGNAGQNEAKVQGSFPALCVDSILIIYSNALGCFDCDATLR